MAVSAAAPPIKTLENLLYGAASRFEIADIARLVLAAEGDDPPSADSEVVSRLFSRPRSNEQKRLPALVLLHVLGTRPELVEDVVIRNRVFSMIEEGAPTVLRVFKVDTAAQPYAKEEQLRRIVPTMFETLDEAASSLTGAGAVAKARNDVMRALGGANKTLLAPFMPAEFRTRINEAFDLVADLAEAEGPDIIAAHGAATECLAHLAADVNEAGPLSVRCLANVVARLRAITREVFEQSPVTDPASLTLETPAKKYPLHAPRRGLRFHVTVCNAGPGQALDAAIEIIATDGIAPQRSVVLVGHVPPGSLTAVIEADLTREVNEAAIAGILRWRDSDGSQRESEFEVSFAAQKADIPWNDLVQPYDLEPVSTRDGLVGRAEILNELRSLAAGESVGSAFVTGQKRVGKTSVARTLQTILNEEHDDLCVVYLEGGEYAGASGTGTVRQMGEAICSEMQAVDPRLEGLPIPTFSETLAPLKDFVVKARKRAPRLRLMVILDEFDALPLELYRRGPVGDALFLSMRSLAGLSYLGFLLVGGEKMDRVIDAQGEELNKFDNHPIDYFDRDRHFEDFSDLVRRPVEEWLEFDDGAILALYELTAGHPFFTKLICRSVFKLMVRKRDAHVTAREIADAAAEALASAGLQQFAHFWEDGILDSGVAVEDVSIRRRKLLLAYGERRAGGAVTQRGLEEHVARYGMTEMDARDTVREFARRGIFCIRTDTVVEAKVGFFDRWLREYGVTKLVTTFSDPEAVLSARARERDAEVKPEELVALVERWPPYRGAPVTTDMVRAWLNQFDTIEAKRLMFRVLQGTRFYGQAMIRERLKAAHGTVRRGLHHRIDASRRKRDDILVSYLGGVGKSGSHYARLYADENGIYSENVVDRADVPRALKTKPIQAVVLVDDLIGSGKQAAQFLSDLRRDTGKTLLAGESKLVYVAIAGFDAGVRTVEAAAADLGLPLELHVGDPLTDEDRCFSGRSAMFPDASSREAARGIAESYGRRLVKRDPLGFNDVQAAIVFEDSCPNNSLPILWEQRGAWRPLFPRYVKAK